MKKIILFLFLLSPLSVFAGISYTSSEYFAESFGESKTVSYTVGAGDNRILFVGIRLGGGSVDNITSVTYNGTGMTKVKSDVWNSVEYTVLYYLSAPTAGANNLVVSTSSSQNITIIAADYAGVSQTSAIDVSNTASTTSATSLTTNMTTTIDNDWLVSFTRTGGTVSGTGQTNTTMRISGTSFGWGDTNADQTPPGSKGQTHAVTGGATPFVMVAAAFSPPFTAAAAAGEEYLILFE